MAVSEKSKANLEKRKKFTKENAKEMQAKGVDSRKAKEVVLDELELALKKDDNEAVKEIIRRIILEAKGGDAKFIEMLLKSLHIFDTKLEVKGDNVEFKLDFE